MILAAPSFYGLSKFFYECKSELTLLHKHLVWWFVAFRREYVWLVSPMGVSAL